MTTIADGLKDVFLAGVGAMALGAEKTQELVEQKRLGVVFQNMDARTVIIF